jgi:hypothetical protein
VAAALLATADSTPALVTLAELELTAPWVIDVARSVAETGSDRAAVDLLLVGDGGVVSAVAALDVAIALSRSVGLPLVDSGPAAGLVSASAPLLVSHDPLAPLVTLARLELTAASPACAVVVPAVTAPDVASALSRSVGRPLVAAADPASEPDSVAAALLATAASTPALVTLVAPELAPAPAPCVTDVACSIMIAETGSDRAAVDLLLVCNGGVVPTLTSFMAAQSSCLAY